MEAESFKDLVLAGTTGKTMMTRYKLTKGVSEKIQGMMENLKTEFEDIHYICICADIWTGATRNKT